MELAAAECGGMRLERPDLYAGSARARVVVPLQLVTVPIECIARSAVSVLVIRNLNEFAPASLKYRTYRSASSILRSGLLHDLNPVRHERTSGPSRSARLK